MSKSELKLKIIREANPPETSNVDEFNSFLPEFTNKDEETGEWMDLSDPEIQGIIEAIEELDDSKGIPHKQVIERFRKKYIQS